MKVAHDAKRAKRAAERAQGVSAAKRHVPGETVQLDTAQVCAHALGGETAQSLHGNLCMHLAVKSSRRLLPLQCNLPEWPHAGVTGQPAQFCVDCQSRGFLQQDVMEEQDSVKKKPGRKGRPPKARNLGLSAEQQQEFEECAALSLSHWEECMQCNTWVELGPDCEGMPCPSCGEQV